MAGSARAACLTSRTGHLATRDSYIFSQRTNIEIRTAAQWKFLGET